MQRLAAVAALAAACAACGRGSQPGRVAVKPNILLITIDTWRADRLRPDLTPNLNALATSGVTFTNARSAAPLTLPSHTTILTGLLPPAHGVHENGTILAESHPTIARLLKEQGYQTAAFIGAFVLDRRFGLARGFDTYDDRIPRDPAATDRFDAERPASAVVDAALAWLASSEPTVDVPDQALGASPPAPGTSPPAPGTSRPAPGTSPPAPGTSPPAPGTPPPAPGTSHPASSTSHPAPGTSHPAPGTSHPAPGTSHPAPGTSHPAPGTSHPAPGTSHPAPSTQHPAPFFLWIHLYDPHAPYIDHERRGANDHERYNGEVAYVDAQIGRVFARLRDAHHWEHTTIIVAGDHGEGLGDHGERTHGLLLYDATLRVPLVIEGPGQKAERRNEPVSLVDIAPTMMALAGIEPSAAMTGRNLLDANGVTTRRGTDPEIYAETDYPHVAGWSPLQALTDGRWKAIRAGGETEVYDLANDPVELKNVAAGQASTASAMAARIETIRTRTSQPAASISAEAQERLRALGYVASSAQTAATGAAPNPSANIAAWNTFEEALTALNERRAAAARSSLQQLSAQYPDAPVFQTTFARAVKESGSVAEALALYRSAAKRWPTDPSLLHDLAVAARDAGQFDEARKADEAALALEPSSALARNGLGLLAIDQGRYQDAVREFVQATELDANNAWYWVNLGNAQHASGDAAGAEHAYRRALIVDPGSADASNGIGVLLVEAKRPAEAVQWFERAIKQSSLFVEAQLNLGIALQQSGDSRRAAEQYPGHPRQPKGARTRTRRRA